MESFWKKVLQTSFIGREEMAILHTAILFTCTLTCVISLVVSTNVVPDYEDLNGRKPFFYQTESAEGKDGEVKYRNKRYPIHLDPHFGSIFRFESGDCTRSADGQPKFFCPYAHHMGSGKIVCLEEWELCDGVKNCPNAEDESPSNCLFYKVMQTQLYTLAASQSNRDEEERKRIMTGWDLRPSR